MTQIVNLTPHSITFVDAKGNVITTIQPSGTIARVKSGTVMTGEFCGIPVTATEYGEVENLPEREDGTIYIVSSLVAQRCPEREDVFIPNESVRDTEGRIIGCRSLGRV